MENNNHRPRKRSVLLVTIELDGVPGWGNDPQDHAEHVEELLNRSISHYFPKVQVLGTQEPTDAEWQSWENYVYDRTEKITGQPVYRGE